MKRLTVEEAVALLRSGEIVALPTETVYGLAGRADSEESVRRIFQAKGRPAENPLICHISSIEMLKQYATFDEADLPLFSLWPGPLTILLKKRHISDIVTAGSDLCAFRMPAHDIFLEAIRATGVPLAAPSANRSGETSPVTAEMVEESLEGCISGVVDGGPCRIGVESTVVIRESERNLRILRPGAITETEFQTLGYTVLRNTTSVFQGKGLLSPGRLPVHYAPGVPLILVDREYRPSLLERLQRFLAGDKSYFLIEEQRIDIERIDLRHPALLYFDPASVENSGDEFLFHSYRQDHLAAFAASLYRRLNQMSKEATVILAFQVKEEGIGRAINDRLRRAASLRLIPSDKGSGR
jgi:L-threonylcarbamoyladenylate synthase